MFIKKSVVTHYLKHQKILLLMSILLFAASCGEPEVTNERITISGEISISGTIETNPLINLTIFHAVSGIGFQEHPLYEIESFTSDKLRFQHTFDYDAKGNRGLLVYAWIDLDGDGINCTPLSRIDLAGVAVNEEFPKTNELFQVEITTPCVGPDWFYPSKE